MTLYRLPTGPHAERTLFDHMLKGKRCRHRHLDIEGRLSGWYKYDRGELWYQIETEPGGLYWGLSKHIIRLGAIPMPAKKGGERA